MFKNKTKTGAQDKNEIGEYLAKLQATTSVFRALCAAGDCTAYNTNRVHKMATFLLVTLPDMYRLKQFFHRQT